MKEHWIGGRRNAKKCTRAPGDVKKEMEEYMETKKKKHEQQWEKYGCSLMCDGWTYGVQRSLINFLVNSPKGSIFIESVDS